LLQGFKRSSLCRGRLQRKALRAVSRERDVQGVPQLRHHPSQPLKEQVQRRKRRRRRRRRKRKRRFTE
jgi:hypothetical protein